MLFKFLSTTDYVLKIKRFVTMNMRYAIKNRHIKRKCYFRRFCPSFSYENVVDCNKFSCLSTWVE